VKAMLDMNRIFQTGQYATIERDFCDGTHLVDSKATDSRMLKKYNGVLVKDDIPWRIEKSVRCPIELHVDITNFCNKSCNICPMGDRYRNPIVPLGHMEFETFKQIVDDMAVYHPDGMQLSLHKDGEPLLHPQLGRIIRYAKDKKAFVHFASNGLFLNKKRRELCGNDLDLLTISITDTTAYEAIQKFMVYKGFGNKPILQLKYYTDYGYQGELPAADGVIQSQLHNWTDAKVDRTQPCKRLLFNPAITWDGKIVTCCVDYRRDRVLGEIGKIVIADIWFKFRALYSLQCMGIFSSPCVHCLYTFRED